MDCPAKISLTLIFARNDTFLAFFISIKMVFIKFREFSEIMYQTHKNILESPVKW